MLPGFSFFGIGINPQFVEYLWHEAYFLRAAPISSAVTAKDIDSNPSSVSTLWDTNMMTDVASKKTKSLNEGNDNSAVSPALC